MVVVPSGVPLRGPDMSSDMRPGAVSEETADSDWSEPLAEGLSGPLCKYGATAAAASVIPLSLAACLLVASWDWSCCDAGPAPIAGRHVAGSELSLAQAGSVAFRFPVADVR
jgi:hypothetical protein